MSDLNVIDHPIDSESKEEAPCSDEEELEHEIILPHYIEIDLYPSEEDEEEEEDCENATEVTTTPSVKYINGKHLVTALPKDPEVAEARRGQFESVAPSQNFSDNSESDSHPFIIAESGLSTGLQPKESQETTESFEITWMPEIHSEIPEHFSSGELDAFPTVTFQEKEATEEPESVTKGTSELDHLVPDHTNTVLLFSEEYSGDSPIDQESQKTVFSRTTKVTFDEDTEKSNSVTYVPNTTSSSSSPNISENLLSTLAENPRSGDPGSTLENWLEATPRQIVEFSGNPSVQIPDGSGEAEDKDKIFTIETDLSQKYTTDRLTALDTSNAMLTESLFDVPVTSVYSTPEQHSVEVAPTNSVKETDTSTWMPNTSPEEKKNENEEEGFTGTASRVEVFSLAPKTDQLFLHSELEGQNETTSGDSLFGTRGNFVPLIIPTQPEQEMSSSHLVFTEKYISDHLETHSSQNNLNNQSGVHKGLSTASVSTFMEHGSGEAATDPEITTVSSLLLHFEPEIHTIKEATGPLSPSVESIFSFEPTEQVLNKELGGEATESISQTSKENVFLEGLGEPHPGREIKDFPTDFPLEEDFSGDFREYSTVSYPIPKEELVIPEGSGVSDFKDSQFVSSALPSSDHMIDLERTDWTSISTSAFPWEEFTVSAEGSGEQLASVGSSVDQVFPSAPGNVFDKNSPSVDQDLGQAAIINNFGKRSTILPTIETEGTDVVTSSTVGTDFSETREPAKLWSRQETNSVIQGMKNETGSEEKIVEEQNRFQSFQSSVAPEQASFDSQTFTETGLRMTDYSVLSTMKTYSTVKDMDVGDFSSVDISSDSDAKALELYPTLPGVAKDPHFFLPTTSETYSMAAENVLTDSSVKEDIKPFTRPTIKELDSDLLFSGQGSGEIMSTIASVSFPEMKHTLQTLHPLSSQVEILETNILSDTTENSVGIEHVSNDLRPSITETDNISENNETVSNTTISKILSDTKVNEPTKAPFIFSKETEQDQKQTFSWAEEIQTSRPQLMTEQASEENLSVVETKERTTAPTVFLTRTYDLEMTKGSITPSAEPSKLFYEHSGEGSGELDMVDLVHTFATTQATRQGSATVISDRSLEKHPKMPNVTTVTVDGFPTVSVVLPLHSEQNKNSPDPTNTLLYTMSYERSPESISHSFQDNFKGFKESTLKPDQRKVTESIILDLDKEDKDLMLTITERPILEILPELTSDKNTIIDIDHTKPMYSDFFGMQTDMDLEGSHGGTKEESPQVQEILESAVSLPSTEENFESSGEILTSYTWASHTELMTSEDRSQLDPTSFVLTTKFPVPTTKTDSDILLPLTEIESDILLPTASSLPVSNKSVTVNPVIEEAKMETKTLDDIFESSTLSDGQAIADQSEIISTVGYLERTQDEFEEKKYASPSFQPEFSSGAEEALVDPVSYVSIDSIHKMTQNLTEAPDNLGKGSSFSDNSDKTSAIYAFATLPSNTPASPFTVHLGWGASEHIEGAQLSVLQSTEASIAQMSPGKHSNLEAPSKPPSEKYFHILEPPSYSPTTESDPSEDQNQVKLLEQMGAFPTELIIKEGTESIPDSQNKANVQLSGETIKVLPSVTTPESGTVSTFDREMKVQDAMLWRDPTAPSVTYQVEADVMPQMSTYTSDRPKVPSEKIDLETQAVLVKGEDPTIAATEQQVSARILDSNNQATISTSGLNTELTTSSFPLLESSNETSFLLGINEESVEGTAIYLPGKVTALMNLFPTLETVLAPNRSLSIYTFDCDVKLVDLKIIYIIGYNIELLTQYRNTEKYRDTEKVSAVLFLVFININFFGL